MQKTIYNSLILITLILSSCDRYKVTKDYVKSKEAINYFSIEELIVDTLHRFDDYPIFYESLWTLRCKARYTESSPSKKIYFNKVSSNYAWSFNWVNRNHVLKTIKKVEHFKNGSSGYSTIPIALKPNTWYRTTVGPEKYLKVFVYFDNDMKSKIYYIQSNWSLGL